MASDRAEQTAYDVIKNLRKPKITKGKILRANGYADSVSKAPTIVTQTKSYQKVIRPFLQRLSKLREKVITEMELKDISQERFSELAGVLRGFNHDIQLLSGEATENVIYQPPIYGGLSRHIGSEKDIQVNQKDKSDKRGNGSKQDS